jgi:hypothetical protein
MAEGKTWRSYGRKSMADLLRTPLSKHQRQRGFAEAKLLTDWHLVVGPMLASVCVPQKLSFAKGKQHGATLHLLCDPAWALEIQYQEPLICEKIASFFGFRAVASLRLHQGSLPAKPAAPKPVAPPDAAQLPSDQRAQLNAVADESLQDALTRLAASRHAARNTCEEG